MGVKKRRKWRQRTPKGERRSRAVHGQESQKAQQRRREDKGRSDKPSKC